LGVFFCALASLSSIENALAIGGFIPMANVYRRYTKLIKHMVIFDFEREAKTWAQAMIPLPIIYSIQPMDGVWEVTWTTEETTYR
jgi:hypothetical protein